MVHLQVTHRKIGLIQIRAAIRECAKRLDTIVFPQIGNLVCRRMHTIDELSGRMDTGTYCHIMTSDESHEEERHHCAEHYNQ